jgi:hypothetical protein
MIFTRSAIAPSIGLLSFIHVAVKPGRAASVAQLKRAFSPAEIMQGDHITICVVVFFHHDGFVCRLPVFEDKSAVVLRRPFFNTYFKGWPKFEMSFFVL